MKLRQLLSATSANLHDVSQVASCMRPLLYPGEEQPADIVSRRLKYHKDTLKTPSQSVNATSGGSINQARSSNDVAMTHKQTKMKRRRSKEPQVNGEEKASVVEAPLATHPVHQQEPAVDKVPRRETRRRYSEPIPRDDGTAEAPKVVSESGAVEQVEEVQSVGMNGCSTTPSRKRNRRRRNSERRVEARENSGVSESAVKDDQSEMGMLSSVSNRRPVSGASSPSKRNRNRQVVNVDANLLNGEEAKKKGSAVPTKRRLSDEATGDDGANTPAEATASSVKRLRRH